MEKDRDEQKQEHQERIKHQWFRTDVEGSSHTDNLSRNPQPTGFNDLFWAFANSDIIHECWSGFMFASSTRQQHLFQLFYAISIFWLSVWSSEVEYFLLLPKTPWMRMANVCLLCEMAPDFLAIQKPIVRPLDNCCKLCFSYLNQSFWRWPVATLFWRLKWFYFVNLLRLLLWSYGCLVTWPWDTFV